MKRIKIADLTLSICLFTSLNFNLAGYIFYEEMISASILTPTIIDTEVKRDAITLTLAPQSTNHEIWDQVTPTTSPIISIASTEFTETAKPECTSTVLGGIALTQVETILPTVMPSQPMDKSTLVIISDVTPDVNYINSTLIETIISIDTPTPSTDECVILGITNCSTEDNGNDLGVTNSVTQQPTTNLNEKNPTFETDQIYSNIATPTEIIPTSLSAFDPNEGESRINIIVKFTTEGYAALQSDPLFSGMSINTIDQLDSAVISIKPSELDAMLRTLQADPHVLYVEPDSNVVSLDLYPDDPAVMNQIYLDNINAFAGWELSTGSNSTVIAILDTGVNLDHPDLVNKILPGINLIDNTNFPQDDNGHGTMVAGIAAANGNNGLGITGVDWNAKILSVKVLDSAGNGQFSTVAEGIIWAVDNGANIINLSLGGTKDSQILHDAVDYATDHNVLVVAASGNNSTGTILYPAYYSSVLSVGATDDQNQHAAFSNYGTGLDVSAPGVSIYSTGIDGGYAIRSGTSFSAPQVSGLAAILCSIFPSCPIDKVETAIISSVLDLGNPGWDPYYGWGLIQMNNAIQYAFDQLPLTNIVTIDPPSVFTNTPFPTWQQAFISKTPMVTSPTTVIISSNPNSNLPKTTIPAPTSNPNSDVSIAEVMPSPTRMHAPESIISTTSPTNIPLNIQRGSKLDRFFYLRVITVLFLVVILSILWRFWRRKRE